jgi:predicted SAM-dependent methyltransferase
VTFGIEDHEAAQETKRLFKANFEETEQLYKNTYDLVWMGHVLEKFRDPLSALWKVREILQSNGVLFISTPDIDFLYSKPHGEWTHWNKSENNIMWSSRSLKRELERLGFTIIVCRRNYYSRYGFYHDVHIIAQKTYF